MVIQCALSVDDDSEVGRRALRLGMREWETQGKKIKDSQTNQLDLREKIEGALRSKDIVVKL
jgi:hypothetical protein